MESGQDRRGWLHVSKLLVTMIFWLRPMPDHHNLPYLLIKVISIPKYFWCEYAFYFCVFYVPDVLNQLQVGLTGSRVRS